MTKKPYLEYNWHDRSLSVDHGKMLKRDGQFMAELSGVATTPAQTSFYAGSCGSAMPALTDKTTVKSLLAKDAEESPAE